MNPHSEYQELKEILLENQKLLIENNQLLKKQQAKNQRDFWLKLAWFFFILVAPTIFLYWYIMPMYSSLGGNSGLQGSVNELNQINELLQKQR